jgi:hypothetical protein
MKETKSASTESLMMQRRIVYEWASNELERIIQHTKKEKDLEYLSRELSTLTKKLKDVVSEGKIPGEWVDGIFFGGEYPIHRTLISEYKKYLRLFDENARVLERDVEKLEIFAKAVKLAKPTPREFASLLYLLDRLYEKIEEKEREAKTLIYLERA